MRNNEDVIPIFQRFDWRYQDTDWKCQYCSQHTNDEFYKKYLLKIVPSEEETIFHQEETLNFFSLLLDADREKARNTTSWNKVYQEKAIRHVMHDYEMCM